MDGLEFAALDRPRAEARRFLEEFKSGRHHPELTARARRLEEVEAEIKQELLMQAMSRLASAEAPGPRPAYAVGLGAILCGGVTGELIGRDFTV